MTTTDATRPSHPNDQLRAPFAPADMGKLPRYTGGKKVPKEERDRHTCDECGKFHEFPSIHLDYVGHAAVTDRLLDVDPEWTWTPYTRDEDGLPRITTRGDFATLWIELTVNGVTRPGVGTAAADKPDLEKELISDALRNAGMRFGIALDLWRKGDQDDDAPAPSGPTIVDRPCPACGRQVQDNREAHRADTKKPAWRCTNRACTGGSNNRSWASWDTELILDTWPEAMLTARQTNAAKEALVERLAGDKDLAARAWREVMELFSLAPGDPIPLKVAQELELELREWEPRNPAEPTVADVDPTLEEEPIAIPDYPPGEEPPPGWAPAPGYPVGPDGQPIYPPGEEPF